ncbi:MAG: sulfite exporter TauE/SafE family protein [Elusimicrobia bacterium]|nr:sulfite exporter TauE/SafE family protein [Elusimicrobiota bacterium]MDE2510872.1 sulfite exporter TauE/SafE family protein [Elusimicrobiota bacterium]
MTTTSFDVHVTEVGAAVGFLSGLLGKGGSAVTTPVLRVFLGVPEFAALASPLPSALPTALSASWAYRGRGMVDVEAVKTSVLWGIPATVLGSLLSRWVGGPPLMILTALFVISLGVSLSIHGHAMPGGPDGDAPPVPNANFRLTVIALAVGLFSGLLANTGGILYAPLFIQWVKMPPKRALASSLIISAVLAIPGTLTHWWLGHIDWRIVVLLSLGAIPCSYLGAQLAIRLRSRTLIRVYGALLTAFGFYDLFFTEHVTTLLRLR